jgi:hypothetical protein
VLGTLPTLLPPGEGWVGGREAAPVMPRLHTTDTIAEIGLEWGAFFVADWGAKTTGRAASTATWLQG